MARLDQPIVIIGAGRSGSSLLGEILDAHPSIHMLGEMDLTVPMLWNCMWKTSAAACERSRRMDVKGQELAIDPRTMDESDFLAKMNQVEHDELDRVRGVTQQALDQMYHLADRAEGFWGFKEIWVRAANAASTWEAYDRLFPNALFVHIVRHPFQYARSATDWNRVELTARLFSEQLHDWKDFYLTNRARIDTNRYVRVIYRDVVKNTRATIEPILSRLNLAWDDACLSALGKKHVVSAWRSPVPSNAYKLACKVPELVRLAAELGFDLSEKIVAKAQPSVGKAVLATRIGNATWRLNAPFIPDSTHGWLANLQMAPELAGLEAAADNLEQPRRSPVQLFENGVPLGPGHCVHWKIRHVGGGGYSHWALGHYLLFSTSDNSDPNTNGRSYTICTKAIQAAAA